LKKKYDKSSRKKAINKWGNSFLRLFVPYNLIEKSTVKNTEDDGAKLVYVKFLYGLQTGKPNSIPFDGTLGNIIKDVNEESLWLYDIDGDIIPSGFTEKTYDKKIIRTGRTRKCGRCSGQGLVTCSTCKGKIRWHEKNLNGDVVEKICSCGNGKENCRVCEGFGDVEDVISTTTAFKINQTKNSQYTGEVPEPDIKKATGGLVYENQFEYPVDLVKKLLIGGLNMVEMNKLNNSVLDALKTNMELELQNHEIDTDKIYGQLVLLFDSIAELSQNNLVLENEFMPIRVLVRVENAPVKQVNYVYKKKDFSLWVYGKENFIWQTETPKSFNIKVISILILILSITGYLIWSTY